MIEIADRIGPGQAHDDHLTLPFELRRRSRQRVRLGSGDDAALRLDRGIMLRSGDRLRASDGRVVLVVGADEPVARVTAGSPTTLARVAYHLGNRHVPLQVGQDHLIFGQDHVLEDMCRGLGASVERIQAPFEPEGGAYGGGHSHAGGQDANDGHDHGGSHHHHHHHGNGHG